MFPLNLSAPLSSRAVRKVANAIARSRTRAGTGAVALSPGRTRSDLGESGRLAIGGVASCPRSEPVVSKRPGSRPISPTACWNAPCQLTRRGVHRAIRATRQSRRRGLTGLLRLFRRTSQRTASADFCFGQTPPACSSCGPERSPASWTADSQLVPASGCRRSLGGALVLRGDPCRRPFAAGRSGAAMRSG